ncbi:MAG: amidohydrolase family protein, partial [Candidatus Binatia bacterium]
ALVFASDYNHSDSKFPDTVKSITRRDEIAPALMAKIMGGNAARLYNL